MATPKNIAELLIRQASGTLSLHDKEVLESWLQKNPGHRLFREEIMDNRQLLRDIIELNPGNLEASEEKIFSRITNQLWPVRVAHRVHFLRTAWFRVAVIILLFSSVGVYLWQTNRSSLHEGWSTTDEASAKGLQNDVMPGSDKAILTLSDGRKIVLDSTAGKTIVEGELQIQNNNSGLIYTSSDVVVNNIMSTPKGGQYQLTLADGTKVWLNAASSITYPTAFKENTREVTITGEAYLEVKQDKQKPFIVNIKDQKIEVLGTAFNVNAYEDEKTKISLVNGAIKIKEKVLKPGQALMDGNIQSTNIEQDIAWKKGVFDFNGMSIYQAMKQIARWYDIEVSFEGDFSQREIRGKIDKGLNLAEVLSVMERTNMHFTLKDRSLQVHE